LLVDERSRHAVEVGERLADGCATPEQVERAFWKAESATFQLGAKEERFQREQRGIREGWLSAEDTVEAACVAGSEHGTIDLETATAAASAVDTVLSVTSSDFHKLLVPLFSLTVFRDVIRNPFRPVTFSADWRTDTAVSLAAHIYKSREFSAMPILADALQDAGWDNEEMLHHCRDTSLMHVRGCWVVDLVLGKE